MIRYLHHETSYLVCTLIVISSDFLDNHNLFILKIHIPCKVDKCSIQVTCL